MYYCFDSYNNKSNILNRTVNVIEYPEISNIVYSNDVITFNMSGVYDEITYIIKKNNIIIETETIFITSIDVSLLTLDNTPYIIIINVKKYNKKIKSISIGLTLNYSINPVIEINESDPYIIKMSSSLNIYNFVYVIKLGNT